MKRDGRKCVTHRKSRYRRIHIHIHMITSLAVSWVTSDRNQVARDIKQALLHIIWATILSLFTMNWQSGSRLCHCSQSVIRNNTDKSGDDIMDPAKQETLPRQVQHRKKGINGCSVFHKLRMNLLGPFGGIRTWLVVYIVLSLSSFSFPSLKIN